MKEAIFRLSATCAVVGFCILHKIEYGAIFYGIGIVVQVLYKLIENKKI